MTGRVAPADDELFDTSTDLDDDVAKASARLDELIGSSAADPDPTYVSLTALVDSIRDDDRLHRVEQVMERSPWSARTTQRVFRRYIGVPVKWVLCRYRLQQAALEIETRPDVDFADLAVRLGWYDQAHFINDFRSMLGSTPGEYAGSTAVRESHGQPRTGFRRRRATSPDARRRHHHRARAAGRLPGAHRAPGARTAVLSGGPRRERATRSRRRAGSH